MRYVELSDNDVELFNQDITPAENTFLMKHMDAFKRMWHEQGKEFWAHFAMNFVSCAGQFGVMKDFPESCDSAQEILEGIFCLIQDQFVQAKFSQAKALLMDIVVVAKNVHLLQYMESNSFARDPFFVKDTRDSFRNLFGPPDLKTSYMNVYILLPIYSRFGGSLCVCLRRWLNAPDHDPTDHSYWTPPTEDSSTRYKAVSTPEFLLYIKERLYGSPVSPCYVGHWMFGDPRYADEDNPLYDPGADKLTDWRDGLRPEPFIGFVKYVDEHYNPANQKNGTKDVTAIAKKKILKERLWEKDSEMQALHEEFMKSCHVHEEEKIECNIVWCSEREYLPDISHCDCCYIENHNYLEDAFIGRIRTDSERSSVIFYTMCGFHNDNMRIEIPVNFNKYRAYVEQPLCELEMEMNETAKTDVIKYVTNIVSNGIPAPEMVLDPIPQTEIPLYIIVTVKWCQKVHGLKIDFEIREMRKRARTLKLGYGGLRNTEDISALTKAITECAQSFIAGLPFCDEITESGLPQDGRDSSARQRLKQKMKQRKKDQETGKAKKAERNAKALLEFFKFEIKNGFPNALQAKQDMKGGTSFPQECQVREQMRKAFCKLREEVLDIGFMKKMDDWLSEEQMFNECLEQAMQQTGVEVSTELGFPCGRTSYCKVFRKLERKHCSRVFFNTSSGPRYVAVKYFASTVCDNAERSPVINNCPLHSCPHHGPGTTFSAESRQRKGDAPLLKEGAPKKTKSMTVAQKDKETKPKNKPVVQEKKETKLKANPGKMVTSNGVPAKPMDKGTVEQTQTTSKSDTVRKKEIAVQTEASFTPDSVVIPRINLKTETKRKPDSLGNSGTYLKAESKPKSKVVHQNGTASQTEETSAKSSSVRTLSSSSPTHSAASSGSAQMSSNKSKKLRKCHFCESIEPEPKAYKKCNKCKTEGVKNARFYCGKECQVDDWKIRHKEEHKNNTLGRRE